MNEMFDKPNSIYGESVLFIDPIIVDKVIERAKRKKIKMDQEAEQLLEFALSIKNGSKPLRKYR